MKLALGALAAALAISALAPAAQAQPFRHGGYRHHDGYRHHHGYRRHPFSRHHGRHYGHRY